MGRTDSVPRWILKSFETFEILLMIQVVVFGFTFILGKVKA